ncbi:MAG TPA: SH3 domain-containing protein, partial [Syntrophorhabdaceae bacterium]|nr:SH3 domain-containing protein [Syntrophorhabdaceae bacterium]
SIPEFWQRLPVRYYFTPLRFEETRELIRYRLNRAGLDVAREVFTDEAIEIIHKQSKGLPRTIIAISDLALLNGFTDKSRKITFKEVSKAINAMNGKGDSLSYVMQEIEDRREMPLKPPEEEHRQSPVEMIGSVAVSLKSHRYIRPVIFTVAVISLILLGALGQRIFSPRKVGIDTVPAVSKPLESSKTENQVVVPPESKSLQTDPADTVETITSDTRANFPKENSPPPKEEAQPKFIRAAIVSINGAIIRSAPYSESQRIITIYKGEMLPIEDETTDRSGMKWYKVLLYNDREGWISDRVVVVTTIKQ